MKITIEQVENGYLITRSPGLNTEEDDRFVVETKESFSSAETGLAEVNSIISILHAVCDTFPEESGYNSRYNKHRVQISIGHGDKYEPTEEE